MRYIGNKTKLLVFIETSITETLEGQQPEFFYDLFSGTGSVAERFKNKHTVIANDILVSSYLITKVRLMKGIPDYTKLQKLIDFLNDQSIDGYISKKFSEGGGERLYFSETNGKKIDGIRINLGVLKKTGKITEEVYEYLLYCLLEQVHKVSNTTGVYGAYLKKLSSNAINNIKIEALPITETDKSHETFNVNCIDLIDRIAEDSIVYIDPPYNARQYGSNYHLLETIVKYDSPNIKIVRGHESKSGLREDLPISDWCKKGKVLEELEKILKCRAKFIFMSYNTESLIKESELVELFQKYGSIEVKRQPYKKYKSNKNKNEKNVEELLFCLKKN